MLKGAGRDNPCSAGDGGACFGMKLELSTVIARPRSGRSNPPTSTECIAANDSRSLSPVGGLLHPAKAGFAMTGRVHCEKRGNGGQDGKEDRSTSRGSRRRLGGRLGGGRHHASPHPKPRRLRPRFFCFP